MARTQRRWAVPWGLVGMLALVWIGEGVVVRTGRTHQIGVSWRLARRASQREARRCGVLVFGDSQSKFGILPAVLEARLEVAAFNLAVLRGQVRSSLALLRRSLAAGARPKAVLVNCTPWLLTADVRLNAALWPEVLGPAELVELARTAHDPMLCVLSLRRWLVPSLDDRDEIRTLIRARLAGQEVAGALDRAEAAAAQNQGAEVVSENRDQSARPPVTAAPADFDPASWRPAAAHEADLDSFLTLARNRGATAYLLVPPMRPDMRGVRAQRPRRGLFPVPGAGPGAQCRRHSPRWPAPRPGRRALHRRSAFEPPGGRTAQSGSGRGDPAGADGRGPGDGSDRPADGRTIHRQAVGLVARPSRNLWCPGGMPTSSWACRAPPGAGDHAHEDVGMPPYAVHLNGIFGGGTRCARLTSAFVADSILGGPGGFSRFLRG